MANNIISAVFSSSNITYTKPAYQYDYGMILKFSGIELPQAYEVHFSNTEFCGESISQIGDESGVTIPDEMFLSGSPIYAWTFLHTGEDDGETVYKTVISINKRAQPSDIEPTPVQQDVITQAIAALNTAVEQTAADVVAAGESAEAAAGSAEAAGQAKDDAVEAKDKAVEAKNAAETAQGKAEDAQRAAEQAAGSVLGLTADATVDANVGTPSVEVEVTTESDHKNMSFAFRNLKGVQGDPGDTGVGISSVVLNADYTLTITLTNGTSYTTSSIRGEVGATPNLTIGTVATLPEGSPATATITGTEEEPVLNLGIPVGDTGDPGISPTITVTEITGGHSVAVTDAQGTQTFDVMDGQDGQSGLITDYVAEEKTPYLFRPSANGLANVISEKPTIVGGTVAWNQLLENGNFESTDKWIGESGSLSASNNELTYTISQIGSVYYVNQVKTGIPYRLNIPSGHVVFLHVETFAPYNNGFYMSVRTNQVGQGGVGISNVVPTPNAWSAFSKIGKLNNVCTDIAFYWSMNTNYSVGDSVKLRNCYIVDLTQAFGSTIADYLYTLESGSSGSGIAKLKEWGFLTKSYYPYNSGALQSVQTSAHVMHGFNQCPFNLTKGIPKDEFDISKCVRVIKGQTYELSHGNVTKATTWRNAFSCFDFDGNRIYTGSDITRISGMLGGNLSGLYYIDTDNSTVKSERFTSNFDGYIQPFILLGDTANDSVAEDTCIHFDGIRNGEYEPYSVHSYPLDSDLVLRGTLQLDASNNLRYDGDVYKCDGSVQRRYGVYTFTGEETWTYYQTGGHNTFNSGNRFLSDAKALGNGVISSEYRKATAQYIASQGDKTFQFFGGPNISFTDDSFTDADAFASHMTGKTLVYELKDSAVTTETADPYSEYQIVYSDGTEEYVDDRVVPIPVGHDTFYQQAVDVPQLPTTDGSYRLALSKTGNTATASWEYVAQAEMKAQTNIPSGKYFSVGERLFVSTQAIAQGSTIVPGTNCTETTLADALNTINS